jgi:TniQ
LFEHGLSGHLWPIHLHPQADELLSSWLTRLRLAYGLAPRVFWPSLSSTARRGDRDIDRRTPAALLALLAQRTATSPPRVFATTLMAYERHLRDLCTPTSATHWLFVNALQNQRHGLPALQYCPQCLRRDAEPYFRRRWRLSFVTLCPIHHCCLLDRCPACDAPVTFLHLPGEIETLTRCMRCQGDVRLAEAPRLEQTQGLQEVMRFQRVVLQALTTGWYALPKHGTVPVGQVLRVCQQLVRILVTRHDAASRRAQLCHHVGYPFFELCFPSPYRRTLDVLSVTARFQLMRLLAWWVADWPEHFLTVCWEQLLWPRILLEHMASPPPWYKDTVHQVSWENTLRHHQLRWEQESPNWHALEIAIPE